MNGEWIEANESEVAFHDVEVPLSFYRGIKEEGKRGLR